MLDMNAMGQKSTIPGHESKAKTSGNFYFLDLSPVRAESGLIYPAIQRFYFRQKYFYAYQQGLTAIDSFSSMEANATPLTQASLELTSTDSDYNNFRVYTMCGINLTNRQGHCLYENNV